MERLEGAKLGIARLWRDPAWRSAVYVLAFLLVVAIGSALLFSRYTADQLKKAWIDREAATLGSLARENPEWAEQWLSRMINEDELGPDNLVEGRRLMERYGLTEELDARWFPALDDYRRNSFLLLSLGAIALLLLAGLLLFRAMNRQLGRIRRLAISLEDAVKHNRPMDYRIYEEGDLGLLANGVQELSQRLRETIGQLHRDKIFLKDTVADISHQLKTPLASLTIYIDLLREGQVDEAHAAEFLERCRGELDRMEWLTLTLLKLARLEADALEMNIREASLADTVRQASISVRRLAEDKQIRIRTEHSDPSLTLAHDAHWIAEALANLLKNAIEHSPPHGVVTVAWERSPVFVHLQIKDQGRGIDPGQLPHIFKKFYRSSQEGSGVGLGLPLAKSIVDKHGGVLSAVANPEGGTVFHLTLPLHPLPKPPGKLTKL
ncbi:sensor histidine kinase [Paenibacillaceae bacterium WGS1546]|uniref:sensor histidine kinase n=1 Tax=Cohnella sp. WGS1546 TaxID=3366810 RepID=UPI00372D86BA